MNELHKLLGPFANEPIKFRPCSEWQEVVVSAEMSTDNADVTFSDMATDEARVHIHEDLTVTDVVMNDHDSFNASSSSMPSLSTVLPIEQAIVDHGSSVPAIENRVVISFERNQTSNRIFMDTRSKEEKILQYRSGLCQLDQLILNDRATVCSKCRRLRSLMIDNKEVFQDNHTARNCPRGSVTGAEQESMKSYRKTVKRREMQFIKRLDESLLS